MGLTALTSCIPAGYGWGTWRSGNRPAYTGSPYYGRGSYTCGYYTGGYYTGGTYGYSRGTYGGGYYTGGYFTGATTGAANGFLPSSMLVYISAGCRVARPVAGPLINMLQAAARAGVPLWTVSCHRTYQQQVLLRQRWCAAGQCYMAAPPGTSNHGWGRAVDLSEPGGMTFNSPGHRWLSANAGAYGFVGLSFEAWHWNWVG